MTDRTTRRSRAVVVLHPQGPVLDLRALASAVRVGSLALAVTSDGTQTWLVGDDRSAYAAIVADLATLVDVVERGLRDDDSIRVEASRLAHLLARRLRRDHAGGLVALAEAADPFGGTATTVVLAA